ncbi:pyrophosphatase PpaX [Mycoplasmatota bacterium WC44]
MKVDTILFDLDGTLVNTNEISINSFKYAIETHYPSKVPNREKIMTFFGPTLQETFKDYAESEEKVNEMVQSYLSHYKEIEHEMYVLYPGVFEVLSKLKEARYNLGIVTTKYRKSAMPSIINFKLDEIFDVIITLDDVENPKPSREPIDIALAKFDNHEGAIMVGDNISDIIAGKNAEVFTSGVAWTILGENVLQELNPDFMLQSMDDLFLVLEKLNT